ncbi:hypothetical protein WR25_25178 [Diploscapter pachys]|uniref:Uncharacterized protein n=1 Tax=Diploscapter pachys TaxID=2018661 RepID=A0A2A2J9S1_9BILA|nr:hypothetical protein WR25_25178 [Diploscapter pachys]
MSNSEYSTPQRSPTKRRPQSGRGMMSGKDRRRAVSPRLQGQHFSQQLSRPVFDCSTPFAPSASALPLSTSVYDTPSQTMQFQHRDPLQLEDELEKCQRKIRELEMDISFEQNNNKDLESSLERCRFDLAETKEGLRVANQKATDLELQLLGTQEQIGKLNEEHFDVRLDMRGKIAELEKKSDRYREMAADEKRMKELLMEEVNELKAALEESREELQRHINFARTQLSFKEDRISKSVSEAMSQVNEKTSMALNELKALSSQIASSSANQPKPPRVSDGHAALNKYLTQKLMDTEARVKQLERELGETKEEGELARTELAELKKHLKEIEDNSENTNKFLHAEISRITRQKAELRCEFLSLQRDYKRLKEDKGLSEDAKEQIRKLERERDTAQTQIAEVKNKLENTETELNRLKDDLDRSAGHNYVIQGLRNELKQLQEKRVLMAKALAVTEEQSNMFMYQKRDAVKSRNEMRAELKELQKKQMEMEGELRKWRQKEEHYKAQTEQLQGMIRHMQVGSSNW